jgi:hypothetical protein
MSSPRNLSLGNKEGRKEPERKDRIKIAEIANSFSKFAFNEGK